MQEQQPWPNHVWWYGVDKQKYGVGKQKVYMYAMWVSVFLMRACGM